MVNSEWGIHPFTNSHSPFARNGPFTIHQLPFTRIRIHPARKSAGEGQRGDGDVLRAEVIGNVRQRTDIYWYMNLRRTALFILLLAAQAHGQDRALDSLRSALDTTRQDTTQLRTLVRFSQIASLSSPDTVYARFMARLIGKLEQDPAPSVKAVAEEAKFHWLIWKGQMRRRVSDYRGAVRLYEEAGRLAEARADTARLLDYEMELGGLYGLINDTVTGLKHGYRAMEYAKLLGDSALAARILFGVTRFDTSRVRLLSSLEYVDAYAKKARWENDAGYYAARGWMLQAHGEHDQAIANLERADSLLSDPDSRMIALYSWFLGEAYLSVGRSDDAIASFRRALSAAERHGINGWHAGCALALGSELKRTGDQAGAEAAWLDALAHARLGNFPDHKLTALGHLKDLYTDQHRYREALETTAQWQVLKDSSNVDEARKDLLRLEFGTEQRADSLQNALEREEASRLLTRQRTQRNVLLGFGAFALVFAVVDYRRRQRIKKEHARSEALLLNILPQEVATELKAKGHAQAKHFETATILFTDFKGFTQASEKMSPQELVEELNTCFKAFDEIITARGIEKIKTIGDAYMCAGGLPDPASSSPADVVHAALEMQAFMKQRKAERAAKGLPAFEMRVGIHTGPVVAGIVGVKKFQYDIWGDTVNTASRMESSGEVGQVNISEATYALVKDVTGLTFTPRGKVQAKGKGEMEMYFVTNA